MKKLLLTLLGLLIALPILAQDFTFTSEGGVTLTFSITDATTKTCAVKAPASTDVAVVDLPSKAIYNGISYSVTSISNNAFTDCIKLTDINIPGTISSIGQHAFDGCLLLKQIDIPSAVTTINTYAFHNCKALTSVTIPNSAASIGTWAFAGCSALETVIFAPSVETISYAAFKECKSLKTIYIGPNIKTIGQDAFGNDPIQDVYITSQTIPATGTGVFNKLSETATLHVQGDEQVVEMYKAAEHWNKFPNIVAINMPQSLSVAAYKTDAYDRYALGSGMNSSSAFTLAMNLNESISFNSCLVNGNYQAQTGDINSTFWRSSKPTVAYVDGDGKITLLAKTDKSNPPVITLESLFAGSPAISFTINTNDFSANADGVTLNYMVLNETQKTVTVTGTSSASKTALTLPASVSYGGNQYSVTAISDIAFFESPLTQVTLPTPIASIGKAAFKGSQALASISLPYSLTSLGSEAFYGCRALKGIELPNLIANIDRSTFHDCKALTTIKMPTSLKTVGSFAFAGSGLQTVIFSPSVTVIGYSSFKECKNLQEAYIGPNVKTIDSDAFGNCLMLANVYLTAPNPPALGTGALSQFSGKLWLQGGEATRLLFEQNEAWQTLAANQRVDYVEVPTKVTISRAVEDNAPARTESEYNSTSHIYATPGDETQRIATTYPSDVTIPYTYWSSSDASKVYVGSNGQIIVDQYPQMGKPVILTAETLYDKGPSHTITVDNYLMTDIEEIYEPEADSKLDAQSNTMIFTTDGLYIGNSINGLTPGIYIVIQGQKKVKIIIR